MTDADCFSPCSAPPEVFECVVVAHAEGIADTAGVNLCITADDVRCDFGREKVDQLAQVACVDPAPVAGCNRLDALIQQANAAFYLALAQAGYMVPLQSKGVAIFTAADVGASAASFGCSAEKSMVYWAMRSAVGAIVFYELNRFLMTQDDSKPLWLANYEAIQKRMTPAALADAFPFLDKKRPVSAAAATSAWAVTQRSEYLPMGY